MLYISGLSEEEIICFDELQKQYPDRVFIRVEHGFDMSSTVQVVIDLSDILQTAVPAIISAVEILLAYRIQKKQIELMEKECYDKAFMEGFFETKQPDELVQRKFEFIMKYVGIIKTVREKKMGNVEAADYYLKLFEKIMTKQEFNKYMTLCMGFIEENERRKLKNIVIIQKEKENVYYLYNAEKQIYEKVETEELINQGIQYYSYKRKADVPITTLIDEKEKELVERNKEHSADIML